MILSVPTRRSILAASASLLAAPALAQTSCELGLPGHVKGPPVWRDYDQDELEAAYNQEFYQPHTDAMNGRLSALSFDLRLRRGYPDRVAYGEGPDEGLDIYRAATERAPVFVFVHGGIWLHLNASMSAFAAEMFLDRGVHFVALDFALVNELAGDLGRMADQVRRGIAWVVRNAEASEVTPIGSSSEVTPRGRTSPPCPSPPIGTGRSACLPMQ